MIPVLCFGNPYMGEDNIAVELARELNIKGYEFRILTNPDDILLYKDQETIIILDVFNNIDDVIVVRDVDELKRNRIYSMHDFDLGFFLKLMKNAGKLKNIVIIGIPQEGHREDIKQKIKDLMESFK